MAPRSLLNLALLALVSALGLYLIMTKPPPETPAAVPIAPFDSDAVTRIQVSREGDPPLSFARRDDTWLMTAPVTAPAHNARINAMLRLATLTSDVRLSLHDIDPAALLLNKPAVVLQLDRHRFLFGDVNPIDERRYVQYEDHIFLLQDTLYHQLRQPPEFFLDNRLLPAVGALTAIATEDYVLNASVDGWQVAPAGALSPHQVQDCVQAWQTGRALRVAIAEPGIPAPESEVRLSSGQQQLAYAVTRTADGILLRRSDLGLVYYVDYYSAARLLPPAVKFDNED